MTVTIKQLQVGRTGDNPQKLIINTNNTIAEVTTPGFLTKHGGYSGIVFSDYQLAEVYTTDGKVGTYQVSVDANGIASLVADTDGIVTLPVVSGNIPKFSGTSGVMVDSGISPSNSAKTKVMMANAAMVVDNFITAADTAGTGKDSGKSASNAAKTKIVMADAATVVDELASFADTAGTVKTTGIASNLVLRTSISTPDTNVNLVAFDVTVTAAALASGASVTLYTSSSTKQYKIRALWVNSNGTNFSGGGGDRLLDITDNTTVYSTVPAADLQTLANTGWGATGLPFPASAAINTSTAAGASLVAKYSGGTADYAAGSVVISGLLQRVA